eukprot:CAMPEP_0194032146 /NCGR_PEP_ID=MMETSP0009_2-20130614/5148_1 /TAXON_ID=210454 /ORGANISM="Grammatophora oceanica, Strain CCMP 410" /LENGTH=305 /DNA_ID=CAMNT_0038672497 /DNA_START=183 /DNA_END=1100 /DNA_ORIENTATION=-
MTTTTTAAAANDQQTTNQTKKMVAKKHLVLVRHGQSLANEYMSKGSLNEWGKPTFRDDPTLSDSPLSPTGHDQTKEMQSNLLETLKELPLLSSTKDDSMLIVVSPLTRTLQTLEQLVLPALEKQFGITARSDNNKDDVFFPNIVAHPLGTERVYTSSDTGTTPRSLLEARFPFVDFSSHVPEQDPWWYRHQNQQQSSSTKEWRPYGQGQWYAVPGEPKEHFQERMKRFSNWIEGREERIVILVSHWAICRHFFDGAEFANCESRILTLWEENNEDDDDDDDDDSGTNDANSSSTTEATKRAQCKL